MGMAGVFPRLALVFVLMIGSACARPVAPAPLSPDTLSPDVAIIESDDGEYRFRVEIADDREELTTGLMFRTELAEDAGMLFDFKRPQVLSMWMKNTLIPLDMAFIDETGVIKRIAANTTPRSLESIPSGGPVLAVLEVNGGTFARLGVETGDRVRHPIFNKR